MVPGDPGEDILWHGVFKMYLPPPPASSFLQVVFLIGDDFSVYAAAECYPIEIKFKHGMNRKQHGFSIYILYIYARTCYLYIRVYIKNHVTRRLIFFIIFHKDV